MFSNKIFMCLVVLQLLYLAGSTRVFLTAICATVAGALYHGDVLGLRGFRVPMAAARICDRTLGRLLHSEPPLLAPQPHQQRATQGEAPQQGSGQGEPPPEALQQLQDMGFSLQQAQVALHLSGNDVQLALALLVSQQQ